MCTHVVLLRGINVGGRNRVPMAGLRELLGGLGPTNVRTHLQSGNVLLSTEAGNREKLAVRIGEGIADRFGVTVDVLVRTAQEFASVVEDNPLGSPSDPAKFLVGFLAVEPDPARVHDLERRRFESDRIRVVGRQAYLWCPAGVRDSELNRLGWERRLGVTATARNWNTVMRLTEMLGE